MSILTVYDDRTAEALEVHKDYDAVAKTLRGVGVDFERWQADQHLDDNASNDEIIAAYRGSVDHLMHEYGFKSVDVVAMRPDHPDKDALRAKFLDEHTHSDFEVRFFVDGRGLFYIHSGGKVYAMLCERNDLISVPANTTHWFDMGTQPRFKAIRLFTTPEGWVAQFTGSDVAKRFPTFDQFVARYA